MNNYNEIRNSVDQCSKMYINTRPVIKTNKVSLDIKDILILGAISGTDCLITGKTGSGKTKLANLVMKGLFGTKYSNKTITPAMQPEDFLDIDFSVIKSGKSFQEAIKPLSILTMPGVILNETNRAPGIIQNYLIPFLDKEMDIQGKEFIVGKELNSGEIYQYRILTINEGEQYSVESIDRAIRDRAVIELPIDIFYQYITDCIDMLRSQQKQITATQEQVNNQTNFSKLINIYNEIKNLDIESEVILFLAYMSGMSYCNKVEADYQFKECIKFSSHLCEGCHYAAETQYNINNLCGNVFAPSQRALINLLKVAKGIAYIKASKINGTNNVKVKIEDVIDAAPLVLYNKLGIDHVWVEKNYQGNLWHAIKEVIRQVKDRFDALKKIFPKNINELSEEVIRKNAEDNCDVWTFRFMDIINIINKEKLQKR